LLAGEYLFREDEQTNEFYLILHGTIALELHKPGQPVIVIATLREGDNLDAAWPVPPYRWTFDVRAAELVRAPGVNARCPRSRLHRLRAGAHQETFLTLIQSIRLGLAHVKM
jgi:hypothetical protein